MGLRMFSGEKESLFVAKRFRFNLISNKHWVPVFPNGISRGDINSLGSSILVGRMSYDNVR